MEETVQRRKLVRDVSQKVSLQLFDREGIIYNKGDLADSIYLVVRGSVSLCLPRLTSA